MEYLNLVSPKKLDELTETAAQLLIEWGVPALEFNEPMNSLRSNLLDAFERCGLLADRARHGLTHPWPETAAQRQPRREPRDYVSYSDIGPLTRRFTQVLAGAFPRLGEYTHHASMLAALVNVLEFCGVVLDSSDQAPSWLPDPENYEPLASFFREASVHLDEAFVWLRRSVSTEDTLNLDGDHIGYKCGSRKEYEELRALLEPQAAFVYQTNLPKDNPRRVAYICLKTPIVSGFGGIAYLELSDQKADGSQQSGFDHLECYPADGLSLDKTVWGLQQKGLAFTTKSRPHHLTWDTKIPSGFEIRIEEEPLLATIATRELLPSVQKK